MLKLSGREVRILIVLIYIKRCLSDAAPKGHLQPLGSHRLPDSIEERTEIPQPLEFWNKYVKVSKPVVLRGAAKHSKAFRLWTDEYLKEKYGKLEIRLERKREKSEGVPVGAKGLGRDTIENFINTYHGTNKYIVSELPTPMWSDISVQPCLTCGTFAQRLVEVDLWVSGGGSQSVLHKDAFNAINCVYNGSKQWKMIEYKYESMIYKAWEPNEEKEIGGYSMIDVNSVDLIKYPRIVDVPWSYVEINAGDCLFLPKSYYHQVNSLGTQNIAVAILFSRLDNFQHYDNSGCDLSQLNYVPLSELDMDWKYPGYGNMTMGNADLESARDLLKSQLDDQSALTLGQLISFVEEFSYRSSRSKDIAKQVFSLIVHNNATFITKEDIDSLSRDDLRTLVLLMERYEPSNTYTYEYSFIDSHNIRELIDELMKKDNAVMLDKFVEGYTEVLGGSKEFALQIFRGLLPKDVTMATGDEVSKRLDIVLRPYVEYKMLVESLESDQDEEKIDGTNDRDEL